MVRLKNIPRNTVTIECDIFPEDSTHPGHIIVDLNSGELIEYLLPKGYEWCMNHVHHAKRKLVEFEKERILPDEEMVMWN